MIKEKLFFISPILITKEWKTSKKDVLQNLKEALPNILFLLIFSLVSENLEKVSISPSTSSSGQLYGKSPPTTLLSSVIPSLGWKKELKPSDPKTCPISKSGGQRVPGCDLVGNAWLKSSCMHLTALVRMTVWWDEEFLGRGVLDLNLVRCLWGECWGRSFFFKLVFQ